MLSQPQEALELHTKQSKAIAATCLAFPHGDVNNFVMGSEDGTVYSGTLNVIASTLYGIVYVYFYTYFTCVLYVYVTLFYIFFYKK